MPCAAVSVMAAGASPSPREAWPRHILNVPNGINALGAFRAGAARFGAYSHAGDADSPLHLASGLQEGRKKGDIHTKLRAIWGIPVYIAFPAVNFTWRFSL